MDSKAGTGRHVWALTAQPSRKGGRRGEATHLCSKSRHPCQPGWWTRGLCRTWHIGSRTYARTGEGRKELTLLPQPIPLEV